MAVTLVQQAKGFVTATAAGNYAATLSANPGAGRLVLSASSVNKNATSLAVASPFTERQEYLGTSVHGALADSVAGGSAAKTATWTKGAPGGGGQVAWGIFETSVVGAVYRTSNKWPNPATDTSVNTITASGLGAAPVAGVVFALLGVDSAWAADFVAGGAFANSADITWTNGFATLAVVQTSSTEGDIVGGAAFVLGYKEVASGGTTNTAVTWAGGADQGYLILSLFDTAAPPTVSAGADVTIDQYEPLVRTATVNNNGAAITAQSWTVQSGPNQVGATLSTTAALNWPPTVGGSYVLRHSATNAAGTTFDDVTVTVNALNFPVTAPLKLTGGLLGAKQGASAHSAPMVLAASQAGVKQGASAELAPLVLSASVDARKINQVLAPMRLFAGLAAAGSSNHAFVTATMRLGASADSPSRATSAPVAATALRLAAGASGGSARGSARSAPVLLSASASGTKLGASAVVAALHLTAGVGQVLHSTPIFPWATMTLDASVGNRSRTNEGWAVVANMPLQATTETSSVRFHQPIEATPLRLAAVLFTQRIVAEARVVRARADNVVKYILVCAARIPQVSGPPTFLEIDSINWTSMTHGEALNETPTLSASVKIESLSEPVLQRLQNPKDLPTELWLYRNGKQVFSGPLLVGQATGDQLSLEAQGLITYIKLMNVESDLNFTGVDQFEIVKALIDQWQTLEHGHYGIDTSQVGQSGIPRTIAYPYAELHNVAQRIDDLTKLADGFDLSIDPASRMLKLYHPQRGADRSTGEDAIIFDNRNVTSGDISFSIAPGDLASDGLATGTDSGADKTLISRFSNPELRAKWGRVGWTGSFQTGDQATLDSYNQAAVMARGNVLLIPGPNARVTLDSDPGSYDVGDTISYQAHSRLTVAGGFRIRKRQITVSETGTESVSVQFV